MTRDTDRRRLRDIYDRNRRRVDAVANSRDRNERRGNDSARRGDNKKGGDKGSAPRRYIVSERVTRRAGFGEGGRQGRVSGGRRRDGTRREDRFDDKKVTRRSHRDRFERAERNGSRKDGNNKITNSRRGSRRDGGDRNASKKKDGNKQKKDNKKEGGRRFSRGADRSADRKKNDKSKKNAAPAKKAAPLSGDDLNAQLEAYKNNEVFNPALRQQQAQQAQRVANTLQSLDAQLDAFRN